MKNPRSDPAPGGSSSQGSGETKVAGVEKTTAWTGEKKTKFQSTPRDLGTTAREPELGQIEGFDWDDAMLKEDIDSYLQRYKGLPDNGDDDAWEHINDQQRKEMELRFAICRIKAYKLSKGEVLTNAELKEMYPPSALEEEGYFQRLEHQFEWYFDPEYCKFAHLEDYQRLALGNAGEYLEWEYYHNTCSTLQSDEELVYFWENLSSKTEWIKKFLGVDLSVWKRIERVVFYHAVKIAKDCKNIYTTLLHNGYSEYLWSVSFDNTWYIDFAGFYFELWKLVAKEKMSFKDALDQVKEKGMRTLCRYELKAELNSDRQWWFGSGPITRHYNTYVAEINENLTDGDAYELVMEAVKKFVPKPKSYYDYAKKKLAIAEKIGLIPPRSERGPTCQSSSEVTA